jgi:hypothetical protein
MPDSGRSVRPWDELIEGNGQCPKSHRASDYLGGSDPAGAQRAMQAMLRMTKLDIAGLRHAYEGKTAA